MILPNLKINVKVNGISYNRAPMSGHESHGGGSVEPIIYSMAERVGEPVGDAVGLVVFGFLDLMLGIQHKHGGHGH
jgi:hypothetical protein